MEVFQFSIKQHAPSEGQSNAFGLTGITWYCTLLAEELDKKRERKTDFEEKFSKSSCCASVRTQQLTAVRGYRRSHSTYRTTSRSGPASKSL